MSASSSCFKKKNKKTTYLSSKEVVAAELTIISTSLHNSSFKLQSSIPKLSKEMSPETEVTFSDINELKFAPKLPLRTVNNSVPIIYQLNKLRKITV